MERLSLYLPLPATALRTPASRTLTQAVLVVLGSLLLTASAKIQVPFWPVPMTLQTGVVLFLALVMGPRLALATVALYLAQGAMGLPVFAGTPVKGIGLAYMMGPTGGYMLGWLLAAAFVGWAAGRWRAPLALFAICLGGVALNYLPGIAWLATFTGLEGAVAMGAAPFILGDVVKSGLAVSLALALSVAGRPSTRG
jgi:biotin transport system substrate-specific component